MSERITFIESSGPATTVTQEETESFTINEGIRGPAGPPGADGTNGTNGMDGAPGVVQSVTGLNTDNTDIANPVVKISVDGTTITGSGTPADPLVSTASGGGTVQSVTGLNTDNTDPQNPIVKISVDGTTVTGSGTPSDPLVAVGTVESVTGLNTDNTDPRNPVVKISVDGSTITGSGIPSDPLVATHIGDVQSVTGLNTDNTDPANPIVKISVDGTTITGDGTSGNPLVASGVQSISSNNPHIPIDNGNPQTPIINYDDAIVVGQGIFQAQKQAGSLVDGWYYINSANGGQNDIIVHAQGGFGSTSFGFGRFFNADYGNAGNYSKLTNTTGIGTNLGSAWFPALTPSAGDILLNGTFDNQWYVNITGINGASDPSVDNTNWLPLQNNIWVSGGTYFQNQVVIWNGQHFANLTNTNTTTPPNFDLTNWRPLSAQTNLGYLLVWDTITYISDSDQIISRRDEFGNEVNGFFAIGSFQWGNFRVSDNIVKTGAQPNILNNAGIIQYCKFTNLCSPTLALEPIGFVQSCEFSGSFINWTYPANANFSDLVVKSGLNTFSSEFDATGGGTIDIGPIGWAGIINLNSSNTTETISQIKGLNNNFPTRFNSRKGKTFTMQHTAINSATAQQIVLENDTDVPLVGRNTVSDNIILESINGICAQVGGAVY